MKPEPITHATRAIVAPDRRGGHVQGLAAALDDEVYRFALRLLQQCHHGGDRMDQLAVNRDDRVAGLQPSALGRITRHNIAHSERAILHPRQQADGFDLEILAFARVGEIKLEIQALRLAVRPCVRR